MAVADPGEGNDPFPLRGSVKAVASDAHHRFGKQTKKQITIIAGYGVEGDAHAGQFIKHRYLMKTTPQLLNNRQVHLIASELFEEVAETGFVVGPGQLGENVTTAGLELGRLPLGCRLHLGPTSVVEITGLRTPCGLIDRFQKGLKRAMIAAKSARPRFRCGVLGVVLQNGVVTIGDRVRVELPPAPWRDLPAL